MATFIHRQMKINSTENKCTKNKTNTGNKIQEKQVLNNKDPSR